MCACTLPCVTNIAPLSNTFSTVFSSLGIRRDRHVVARIRIRIRIWSPAVPAAPPGRRAAPSGTSLDPSTASTSPVGHMYMSNIAQMGTQTSVWCCAFQRDVQQLESLRLAEGEFVVCAGFSTERHASGYTGSVGSAEYKKRWRYVHTPLWDFLQKKKCISHFTGEKLNASSLTDLHPVPHSLEGIEGGSNIEVREAVARFVDRTPIVVIDDVTNVLPASLHDPVVTVKRQLVAETRMFRVR